MIFGPYHAVVVDEHDGDTVYLDVRLLKRGFARATPLAIGFGIELRRDGVWLKRQSVRTLGDNAPELKTAAGKAALAYLGTVLRVGDTVTLTSTGWDKFGGRIDGTITLADGRDLAQLMIAAGQAFAWNGKGAKPTT